MTKKNSNRLDEIKKELYAQVERGLLTKDEADKRWEEVLLAAFGYSQEKKDGQR